MVMYKLDFPSFSFEVRKKGSKAYILDRLRKKYVVLTPEEWVRQHVVFYLVDCLAYPVGLMSIERKVILPQGGYSKRADVFVYSRSGKLMMLVECKSPEHTLNEMTVKQMMGYNVDCVPFLLFTNGMHHFCFQFSEGGYALLAEIPRFDVLENFL